MQDTEIKKVFKQFNNLKALIIGDVMVDAYDWGKVERISPEAPVPIISITKKEKRLGGAANVAINIKALGATPILCSVIGEDQEGNEFLDILSQLNIPHEGIIKSPTRITTSKRRILAGGQHLLRIDHEIDKQLTIEEENALFQKITMLIDQVDVVIFEDYDKGVISENLISKTIALSKLKNKPVAVDPKKRNFLSYKGVSLFKPNLKELKDGLKIDIDPDNMDELNDAVNQLNTLINADSFLITLSERGVFIQHQNEWQLIPAHSREITDVSGAGDTVISTASLCLALGLPFNIIAEFANLSGGLVCEHLGAVPIQKEEFEKEALKLYKQA